MSEVEIPPAAALVSEAPVSEAPAGPLNVSENGRMVPRGLAPQPPPRPLPPPPLRDATVAAFDDVVVAPPASFWPNLKPRSVKCDVENAEEEEEGGEEREEAEEEEGAVSDGLRVAVEADAAAEAALLPALTPSLFSFHPSAAAVAAVGGATTRRSLESTSTKYSSLCGSGVAAEAKRRTSESKERPK